MVAETDKFIIATFALWAGDFAYCEKLLREYSPPYEAGSIDEGVRAPEDFIRATGALRLRQLWQKRGEFKKLAAEYEHQGVELTDRPIILETKHLRATVWRSGEREFFMQGYLKELTWQESLFTRASREASTGKTPKARTDSQKFELFGSEAVKPLGSAWVVTGNPFLQVELTDMGLIEASGLWTEPLLPESAEAITDTFLRLLKVLDEPEPFIQTET